MAVNMKSRIGSINNPVSVLNSKITEPVGLLTNYINAMIDYETLDSDVNYRYLEVAKKEYKDFIAKVNNRFLW